MEIEKWKVEENSITPELAFREFVDKVDVDKLEKEGVCADYKPKINWTISQVKSVGANSYHTVSRDIHDRSFWFYGQKTCLSK